MSVTQWVRGRRLPLLVGVIAVLALVAAGTWWGIDAAHARALARAQDAYASAQDDLASARDDLDTHLSEAQALLDLADDHDLTDTDTTHTLTDAVTTARDALALTPTAPTDPDDTDALQAATTSTQDTASSVADTLTALTRASGLLAADELAGADKAATTARTNLTDALTRADGVDREGVDDATLKTLDDAIATARGIVLPGDQGWTEPTTTDTSSGAQSGTQSGAQSGGGDTAPTAALITTHFDAAASGQRAADALDHAIDAATQAHQAWADEKAAAEAAAAAAAAQQAPTYTGGGSGYTGGTDSYYSGSTPTYTGGGSTGGGSSSGGGGNAGGGGHDMFIVPPQDAGDYTGVCYSEGC
jgi:hypothetical protein